METKKDDLNFCNAAVIYDYKDIDVNDKLNRARKCIINDFHETMPIDRILLTLSIIDVVILENHDNDIETFIENIQDLRENVIYMLSLVKVIREEAN